jgi:hypothetical protein
MKIDIFTIMRRLRRLSRPNRIAHLRALISLELPRSQRRHELEAALKHELVAQLKSENRAA